MAAQIRSLALQQCLFHWINRGVLRSKVKQLKYSERRKGSDRQKDPSYGQSDRGERRQEIIEAIIVAKNGSKNG